MPTETAPSSATAGAATASVTLPTDVASWATVLAALVFVLVLVALLALVLRWLGSGRLQGFGRSRRLALVEVKAVDSRRRLVLVRRDDKEHLLLIGGGEDLVVETGIPAASFQAEVAAARAEPERRAPMFTRKTVEAPAAAPVAAPPPVTPAPPPGQPLSPPPAAAAAPVQARPEPSLRAGPNPAAPPRSRMDEMP